MQFILISGMSGAGKSKAVSFLEDLGFYCVDNMPVVLIPQFAELCLATRGRYEKVALVTDVRGGSTFDELFKSLDSLDKLGCAYQILFMEAGAEAIIKRYKETRRKHPLTAEGLPLGEAVEKERGLLAPIRSRADFIIDTTALSTAKLRGELIRIFGGDMTERAMVVSVISFGYKYGLPIEADLVLDVRFLPNPYYINELKPLTGLDERVRSFIFSYRQTIDFMSRLQELLSFLLPLYMEEGKTSLVIAVGCTGGKHRSVAVAKALGEFVQQKGYNTVTNHRDMSRE